MDKKINNFDFDFMPIGQAIKKAREAKKVQRTVSGNSRLFCKAYSVGRKRGSAPEL